jgi:TctA family transporter
MTRPASLVWAGVQEAGAASQARVSYTAVPAGHPAEPVLNSLFAQRCTVIAAVGTDPVRAVQAAAAGGRHKQVRFAVAGAGAGGVVGFGPTQAATQAAVAPLLAGGAGTR